jgi:hypothetical protein
VESKINRVLNPFRFKRRPRGTTISGLELNCSAEDAVTGCAMGTGAVGGGFGADGAVEAVVFGNTGGAFAGGGVGFNGAVSLFVGAAAGRGDAAVPGRN